MIVPYRAYRALSWRLPSRLALIQRLVPTPAPSTNFALHPHRFALTSCAAAAQHLCNASALDSSCAQQPLAPAPLSLTPMLKSSALHKRCCQRVHPTFLPTRYTPTATHHPNHPRTPTHAACIQDNEHLQPAVLPSGDACMHRCALITLCTASTSPCLMPTPPANPITPAQEHVYALMWPRSVSITAAAAALVTLAVLAPGPWRLHSQLTLAFTTPCAWAPAHTPSCGCCRQRCCCAPRRITLLRPAAHPAVRQHNDTTQSSKDTTARPLRNIDFKRLVSRHEDPVSVPYFLSALHSFLLKWPC